jgi:transposase
MKIRSVGIDLGKTTFHLVALDAAGKVLVRKKFTQRQLIVFTANMPSSLIGLEACSGAHFLGRILREQGHNVKLIPAQFVKPFVKSNKNDFVDAEAIAEAVDRQNMRFVPIKTDDQLDLQAIHRVRDRLISRRTAVINQVRAFLLERGMTFAKSPAKLRKGMPDVLEDTDSNLTPRMRNLLELLWSEWKTLDQQLDGLNEDLEQIASADAACQRLRKIPGIGPLISTAIVAAIGNGAAFHKGRDFCSVAGACTEAALDWGKSEAAWYQQAWEPISAADPDPRSTRRCPPSQARTCTDGRLDDSARSPGAPQRIDCSHRQQAGADCLGGVVER